MRHTDLLVIGGGVAGLYGALTAAAEGAEVVVLSKGSLFSSNSYMAQGERRGGARRGRHARSCMRSTQQPPVAASVAKAPACGSLQRMRPHGSPTWSTLGVEFEPGLAREGRSIRAAGSCTPAVPRRASESPRRSLRKCGRTPASRSAKARTCFSLTGSRTDCGASAPVGSRGAVAPGRATRCSRPAAMPRCGSARRTRRARSETASCSRTGPAPGWPTSSSCSSTPPPWSTAGFCSPKPLPRRPGHCCSMPTEQGSPTS